MLQPLKRLIIPDPPDDVASHMRNEKLFNDAYRIYELGISQLASKFLHYSKPVKHLLKDIEKKEDKPRNDGLKKIYRKFRELAYHMWCQPSKVTYRHDLQPFNPDYMELHTVATRGRQGVNLEDFRDSKVLIRLCPLIRGCTIIPTNGIQTITYLRQSVWTVDCQTFSQWKASQSESSNEPSDAAAQDQEIKHTNDDMASPPDSNFETVPDGATQVQETKHADDSMVSLLDGDCDKVPELPEVAAEQTDLTGSSDTNDATKDNNLDAMEQD